MINIVNSAVLNGISATKIDIEVDISNGFPNFVIVGLADTTIKESKERISVAIENSGFQMPHKKITVNFVPTNIKKDGSHLDLGIAMGILASSNQINKISKKIAIIGELTLNADVKRVKGILSILISLFSNGIKNIIIPYENLEEAKLLKNINVFPVQNLNETVIFLNDINNYLELNNSIETFKKWIHCNGEYEYFNDNFNDFSEIYGQKVAKRAFELASAAKHNILMMGPPGCGKTMMARRITSIMPKLTYNQILELTKIYSISNDKLDKIVTKIPFRAPHHSISEVAMNGGGSKIKAGEITMSHCGVLFLDELLEFKKNVIDSLRMPIEDKKVLISRANSSVLFPCDFLLIAAFNPCPCGFYKDSENECTCTMIQIQKYIKKLSMPILDRFDIQIILSRVEYKNLRKNSKEESSKSILKRVEKVRKIQEKRFESKEKLNSNMTNEQIKEFCQLDEKTENYLEKAYNHLKLSIRSLNNVLKLSRTIADFEESKNIELNHLIEALQYRKIEGRINNF